MAFDNTPPREKTMLHGGILSALTLLFLIPLFHSYFNYMMQKEYAAKVEQRPNTELERYRGEQQRLLGSARVSVEQAMSQLAQQGRTGSDAIAPRRNLEQPDVDAVEGWTLAKNERGAAQARAAFERAKEAREAREAANAADAGVAPATEAAPAPAQGGATP